MSNFNLKMIAVAVVLLLVVAVIALQAGSDESLSSNTRTVDTISDSVQLTAKPALAAPRIGTEWRWESVKTMTNSANDNQSENMLPFTAQSVYDALQEVKLDQDGNVILDHAALVSLDEALERIYNQLDDSSATYLSELIETALPGKAGQQTAELVDDYRQFLRAKEEFSQMYENTAYANDQTTLQSLNSDQRLYAELQALREVYLGRDVAGPLFSVTDANAQYMFESMKLGLDPSLSAEEVAARQQQLQELLKRETDTQASVD